MPNQLYHNWKTISYTTIFESDLDNNKHFILFKIFLRHVTITLVTQKNKRYVFNIYRFMDLE